MAGKSRLACDSRPLRLCVCTLRLCEKLSVSQDSFPQRRRVQTQRRKAQSRLGRVCYRIVDGRKRMKAFTDIGEMP